MKHIVLFLIPNLCVGFTPSSYTHPVESLKRRSKSTVPIDYYTFGKKRERHVWRSATTKQDGIYPRVSFSRRSRSIISKGFHFLIDAVITIITLPIAVILAKIINHSSVREALGQCIVSGIKQMCVDPELDYYFDQAGTTLNHDLHLDARTAGEEFPSLAKNFVMGVIGAGVRKRNDTPEAIVEKIT